MLELLKSKPLTVGEIGMCVGMDAGTITPLLKPLEIAKILSRVRDLADERRVLIGLNFKGESLHGAV